MIALQGSKNKNKKNDAQQMKPFLFRAPICRASIRVTRDPRLAILRLHLPSRKSVSIINCYSPILAAEVPELDTFCDSLEEVIHKGMSFYIFVVGEFNARLGTAEGWEYRIGKFGFEDRSDNYNRLA